MLATLALIFTPLFASIALGGPVQIIDQRLSLPFVKSSLGATSLRGLVDRDRARARSFKSGRFEQGSSGSGGISTAVTNAQQFYIASVQVGNPATAYKLIVDSGSSITWVGAMTPYKKTSTSNDTGATVHVEYGTASFSGEEFTDRVSFGTGLVINNQSIGVANTTTGFDGLNIDGILGFGPVGLTKGVLSTNESIPTVTDNLFAAGTISHNTVSVSFEPASTSNNLNGELTFGVIDSKKFTGSLTYAPITTTKPANEFWGINQAVAYGPSTILSLTAGTIDTGTALVLIATDAFKKYQSATGGVTDSATGLLRVTSAQFSKMQNLNFVIAGTTFALTPNAQIWPRAFNTAIGGTAGRIYLVVADLGSPSGEGLDFINGMPFVERFYTVFDTANQRIGFASTQFTTATTN